MRFSISKLKSVFGASKPDDEQQNQAFTEAIINDVEGVPFALSDTNVIYAGMSELAGYHYLKTVVIGTFKIKTLKGATLTIHGDDFTLQLPSDMLELNSELSSSPDRQVTTIDFEIEEADLPKIKRSKIQSLQLSTKKKKLVFHVMDIVNEEEE